MNKDIKTDLKICVFLFFYLGCLFVMMHLIWCICFDGAPAASLLTVLWLVFWFKVGRWVGDP